MRKCRTGFIKCSLSGLLIVGSIDSLAQIEQPYLNRVVLSGDKVPFNSKFPLARFPLAQGVDGCSSHDADMPNLVRDNWGIADFTKACNAHDVCYYTLGSSVNHCNAKFQSNLFKACENRLDVDPWLLATGFALLCPAVAEAYHSVVVAAEDSTFSDAQDLQRSYVNSELSLFFASYIGREPTAEELANMFHSLRSNTLFGILQNLVHRFGKEISIKQFEFASGFLPVGTDLHVLMSLLQSGGFDYLNEQIYLRFSERIVLYHYREITGLAQPDVYELVFLKRYLEDQRDLEKLKLAIQQLNQ